jgi:competence protein ComEA
MNRFRAAAIATLALWAAGCGRPAYQVFAVRVASAPKAPPALYGNGSAGEAGRLGPARGPADEDGKLDLNRASAVELRRLPGAGATVIAAILAGRPYAAKRQLLERGVLSAAQYASWKDDLVVHRTTAAPAPAPRRSGGLPRRPRN